MMVSSDRVVSLYIAHRMRTRSNLVGVVHVVMYLHFARVLDRSLVLGLAKFISHHSEENTFMPKHGMRSDGAKRYSYRIQKCIDIHVTEYEYRNRLC